jgi:hypothetical protein
VKWTSDCWKRARSYLHSIARIQAVTQAIPVCVELKKHADHERVASAAIHKLYDLFQTEVRNAGEEALGQRVVCIEHVLSADAIEPVLARMLNHGGNECIHVHGSWLLGAFPRHNRNEAPISLLISKNCAQPCVLLWSVVRIVRKSRVQP